MKQEEPKKNSEPVIKSICVTKRKLTPTETILEESTIEIISDNMKEVLEVYKKLKEEK